jgi:sec-independent protein translocase protein TatB
VFDVGFSELMVIAVVALVVIGPERMPGFARTAGALFGRAQRYANKLKAEIQNEMDMEEINRIKSTFYDAAKSIEQSVNQTKQELDATAASLNAGIAAQPEAPAAAGMEAQASAAADAPASAAIEAPASAAFETSAYATIETADADAQAQRDFWLDSTAAASPAGAPRT